jgi:DNA helicase-2/ATP-dependent DNA helicase PcrA
MALTDPGGLEEERRLLYVALTRAKDHLAVSVPQRFYHHRFSGSANHSYALPSRFLEPAAAHFATVAVGVPDVEDVPDDAPGGPDVVAAVLEELWG